MNTMVQVGVGDLVGVAFAGGCGLVALVGLFVAWRRAVAREFRLRVRAEFVERWARFERELAEERVGWAEKRAAFWQAESDRWFVECVAK